MKALESQQPTRFDLKIKVVGGQSFVLSKVKQHTTIFEIKQGIEKLKRLKMESVSVGLPDHLKAAVRKQLQGSADVREGAQREGVSEQQYLESRLIVSDERSL